MYSSTRSSLQRRECSTSRPDRFTLEKGSRCPLHTRLCWSQYRSGQFGLESNISSDGLRTLDRPALSWSLNRLHCLGWAEKELLLSVNCGTMWKSESKERLIKAVYCTSDSTICIVFATWTTYIYRKRRFSVAAFAVVQKWPHLGGAMVAVNYCCQYRPRDNWISALALHVNSVSMKRLPSCPLTPRVMDWLQDECRNNEGPRSRPYEGSLRTANCWWELLMTPCSWQ